MNEKKSVLKRPLFTSSFFIKEKGLRGFSTTADMKSTQMIKLLIRFGDNKQRIKDKQLNGTYLIFLLANMETLDFN